MLLRFQSPLYRTLLTDISNSIELPSLQAILGSMVGLLHEQFVPLIFYHIFLKLFHVSELGSYFQVFQRWLNFHNALQILTDKGECYRKDSSTISIGMEGISELEADKQLVILSADLNDAEGNICHHHLQFYLVRLESFQRVCCDPFENHKKPIKGRLRNITAFQRAV